MTDSYRMPDGEVRHEIDKIKGSRFIATLAPASTPEEAEDRIERIKAEFHDARHTCSAWRIGPEGATWRAHDDGEPSGSAGRPILAQIEGHELTECVLAVTRYFGGTKLGVGGLVRAYGGAAAEALERARVRVVHITVAHRVRHPYACSGAVEGLLAARGLTTRDASYGEDVSFVVDLSPADAAPFLTELVERTSGLVRTEPLAGEDEGT